MPPAQPASVQASVIPQEPPKQGGVPTTTHLGSFSQQAAPKPQEAIAAQPRKPTKLSIEPPGRSCSSCSLPTTTTRAPPPAINQGNGNNNYNIPNQYSGPERSPQSQQAFPPSSPRQQNTAQGGPSGSSYNPQGSQPAFPPLSSGQQNTAQGGSSGSAYNPQGGQPAFPLISLGQQNTAQGGFSGSSYTSQGGQPTSPPSSPRQQNTAQGGPSGSSYNPQGSQQNYPSGQQNIPQDGLVARDDAQSFAPQPGQAAQNYPGSASYSEGPGASKVPNKYAQPKGAIPSPGQTQGVAGKQAGLFADNNKPYTGDRRSGSANSVPDAGNFVQNNAQQSGLFGPNAQPTGPNSYPQGGAGERAAKQYNGPDQQYDSRPNGSQGPGAAQGGTRGSAKPTLFSAQMQIVDKNTDIYALGPNEQKGLPPGLSQGDMTQLLYTFNYTVGFHGHFEEGYTNGVKKGYYFVTGRNGVRTRIDYVADDTGFHPKVSQDVLDLLSEDVPKPETEKDEKYGLKGYEFKWLYYPVESKKR